MTHPLGSRCQRSLFCDGEARGCFPLFWPPPTFKDEGGGGGFPFTLLESFFASPLPSKAPTTALGNDYCDAANRNKPSLPLSLAEITAYGLRPQKKAIRPACHLPTFNTVPRCIQIIDRKIKLCTNPVCRHVARSCSVCHRNEGGNPFLRCGGNFNSFQSPTLNLDTSSNGAGGNLTP